MNTELDDLQRKVAESLGWTAPVVPVDDTWDFDESRGLWVGQKTGHTMNRQEMNSKGAWTRDGKVVEPPPNWVNDTAAALELLGESHITFYTWKGVVAWNLRAYHKGMIVFDGAHASFGTLACLAYLAFREAVAKEAT